MHLISYVFSLVWRPKLQIQQVDPCLAERVWVSGAQYYAAAVSSECTHATLKKQKSTEHGTNESAAIVRIHVAKTSFLATREILTIMVDIRTNVPEPACFGWQSQ